MKGSEHGINLVLVSDDPDRAALLRCEMEKVGIEGVIRRIAPGSRALDCARRSGPYREKSPPDLIFFDFSSPSEKIAAVLADIAFGNERAGVPVVVLTDSRSLEILDSGELGDAAAIMFSPTNLPSFVGKMKNGQRTTFLKALNTLYQYGPILVRLPETAPAFEPRIEALSA